RNPGRNSREYFHVRHLGRVLQWCAHHLADQEWHQPASRRSLRISSNRCLERHSILLQCKPCSDESRRTYSRQPASLPEAQYLWCVCGQADQEGQTVFLWVVSG